MPCRFVSAPCQMHQPFADFESHDGGKHSLDDRCRKERQDTGGDAGGGRRCGDQAEEQYADHIVERGAERQPEHVAPAGVMELLRAVPDRVSHERKRPQKAAGGVNEVLYAAGETCEHGRADRAEQQIGKCGKSAFLCAEQDGDKRDREGLHRHRHAHRHGDGELRHDGDDRGTQGNER